MWLCCSLRLGHRGLAVRAPPGHPFLARTPELPREMLDGLRAGNLWPILALNFCCYACTFTWAGHFAPAARSHPPRRERAGRRHCLPVGMLSFGRSDRLFDTRKWIAFAGNVAIVGSLACACVDGPNPLPVAAIIAMGFFSSSSTTTHGRGIFPDRLIGRGIATIAIPP